MAYSPITWRNVQSSAPVGAAIDGIQGANQAFQNMISGFKEVGEHFDNRKIAANEQDFRSYLAGFDSPEAFQAAQASGEVQARLDGYGDFRNAGMQSLMDGRLGTLRDQVKGDASYQDWTNNRDVQPMLKEFNTLLANGDVAGAAAMQEQIQGLATAEQMAGLQSQLTTARGQQALAGARADMLNLTDERNALKTSLADVYSNKKPKDGGPSDLEKAQEIWGRIQAGKATPEEEQKMMNDFQAVGLGRTTENLLSRKQAGIAANLPVDVQEKISVMQQEKLAGQTLESMYPQEYQADVNLQMSSYLQANPAMQTNELINGSPLPPDQALNTFADAIVKRTDKEGEGANTLDSDTSTKAAEAFNLIFQEGISDGKGNKATLPMSEGAIKLVANAIESDRWFEADATPEEIARSFVSSMGANDKFKDYQKYSKEQSRVKKLTQRKYGLNNPMEDLKSNVQRNRKNRKQIAIEKAEKANLARLAAEREAYEAKALKSLKDDVVPSWPSVL